MTKKALKQTVGFCAAAWQANSASRWVDGVLRYVTETPGLVFRDFSFQQEMRTHAWVVCCMCEELGLEVPGEVAVLGSGDWPISRCQNPTLSSVRTAAETVGFEAMKLLHRLMDGAARPGQPLLIGPEGVVERESTCAEYREGGDVRRALEFSRQHACEGIKVADVVRHLRIARRPARPFPRRGDPAGPLG